MRYGQYRHRKTCAGLCPPLLAPLGRPHQRLNYIRGAGRIKPPHPALSRLSCQKRFHKRPRLLQRHTRANLCANGKFGIRRLCGSSELDQVDFVRYSSGRIGAEIVIDRCWRRNLNVNVAHRIWQVKKLSHITLLPSCSLAYLTPARKFCCRRPYRNDGIDST